MADNSIWRIARREIKRMVSRKIYVFVTLILPLFAFVLFISLFHSGVARKLPVALVDNDNSQLSHTVARMIAATPSVNFAYKVESLNEAEVLIQKWKCYAVVYIPEDFEKNTLRGEAPGVVLYYNNINLAASSSISKDVRTAVGTLSGQIKVATKMQKGAMLDQAKESSFPVTVDTHVLYNPYVSYNYFITTSMLPIMLQMFVLLMSIYAIGVELKEHTAGEWLEAAGGRAWVAVTGKLLPYTVIYTAVALFMNMLIFKYLQVPLKGGIAGTHYCYHYVCSCIPGSRNSIYKSTGKYEGIAQLWHGLFFTCIFSFGTGISHNGNANSGANICLPFPIHPLQ